MTSTPGAVEREAARILLPDLAPLYLGGNVFMFLGATLVLGTPSGVVLTIAHLPIVDWMMRREEKQLAQKFGEEWTRYTHKVRRWL
jgi:protein-S-isoprenylcysteine O-methyltransferase Ste14